MSESSIPRWNAIPLEPTDEKRPTPDGDDGDNNVSLVSRSPSPPSPPEVGEDIGKYDEYVRGVPRDVITVETKIKPTNKGFEMLAKLGWVEGQPLGISGDGRIDPVPFRVKMDSTGLGKTSQDFRMIETTVSQRRELVSERQQKETRDQRRAREELVARKSALQDEISSVLKAFYCTLCDKQFKTVAQYDEHTNSYAHHHKARFKDMQANVRLKPKDEADKRKEKERKREEKELRKIAAANGIKMAKPVAASTIPLNVGSSSSDNSTVDAVPAKKGGWATIASPITSSTQAVTTSMKQATSKKPPSSDPVFRTAGWTSLDTGESHFALPDSQPVPKSRWSAVAPTTDGWTPIHVETLAGLPIPPSQPPPPPPSSPPPSSQPPPPPPPFSQPPPPPPTQPPPPAQPPPTPRQGGWSTIAIASNDTSPPASSGWKRFQESGKKRR